MDNNPNVLMMEEAYLATNEIQSTSDTSQIDAFMIVRLHATESDLLDYGKTNLKPLETMLDVALKILEDGKYRIDETYLSVKDIGIVNNNVNSWIIVVDYSAIITN